MFAKPGLELRPQFGAGISHIAAPVTPGIACKFQLQKDKPYSAVLVCEVLKEEGESTSEGGFWLQSHAFRVSQVTYF